MALTTAQDLIDFALRVSSVTGQGQSPSASDEADGLLLLNMLLSEWQMNRWLVWDIVNASRASTGATSYTVGAAGDFALSYAGQRPDRIDSAVATEIATGKDTILYPFMSQQGYSRVVAKGVSNSPTEAYFYDAGASTGRIFFYPVPFVGLWKLSVWAKADLGQFASLAAPIAAYPQQYIAAMLWNLAERMRPLYGMQPRADITQMAKQSLIAIGGSQAQMIQAQQPVPSNRAGVFSHVTPPPAQGASQ